MRRRGGLDALGWALLLAAHVPAAFRTRAPLCSFLGVVAFVAPYHALDYHHAASGPVTYLALYTVAVLGTPGGPCTWGSALSDCRCRS